MTRITTTLDDADFFSKKRHWQIVAERMLHDQVASSAENDVIIYFFELRGACLYKGQLCGMWSTQSVDNSESKYLSLYDYNSQSNYDNDSIKFEIRFAANSGGASGMFWVVRTSRRRS